MVDDVLDRLTALIQSSYHGDSMETMRDPIATLLAAQDEIKELREAIKACPIGPCPVLAHLGLKELV